jgi:hypothetical protein
VGERSDYPDPFTRGLDYLQQVQRLSPASDLIDLDCSTRQQIALCTWIGLHIDPINAELYACLQVCQACFQDWQQPPIQVFAAPFRSAYPLDGLCNLDSAPYTILIDVGRVVPQDWLGLVVHEYAHVQVNAPGHEHLFFNTMTHLCLGLGLSAPPDGAADRLCHWPPVRRRFDPMFFWMGHDWPCALPVTEYYSQVNKE